jgi:hypothetical protein
MDTQDGGTEANEALDLGVVSLWSHDEVEVDSVLNGLWLGDGLEEDSPACSESALVDGIIGMSQGGD